MALVIIYEKIWYFSESKTTDVHWLGLNVSFPSYLFKHVFFRLVRGKLKII